MNYRVDIYCNVRGMRVLRGHLGFYKPFGSLSLAAEEGNNYWHQWGDSKRPDFEVIELDQNTKETGRKFRPDEEQL